MTCAACGTALPAGAKFCAECGTPTALACRLCGTELPLGAKFCLECGSPAGTSAGAAASTGAPAPPAAPVSERRVTSVLFGDLVGFTSLSEVRDPEEVRELLGRYFDTARHIVARYGGTIEKFIGDAVMAVWGVPTAHEDDSERAVRAGLDLAEAVTAFGESVGAPGLAMRVGVVTGEVAVTLGATGQGMVAGDAVNTAARVQAKATPGTVWVDAQTRSLTGGSIDFAAAGVHELKGKAEPVELFTATAVRGGVGGERSSDRVQAPLVGRRRELSVLKEMFHVAAEEGRPRLVMLSGDAGVGKTRLSWELENYIDGLSATVLWHRGRCLAYGDGVAFSALNSAVRGRIGAAEDDTETATRDKLTRSLETYVPDAAERAWLAPALASLLGLAGGTKMTREDLFSAWLTWFERLSRSEDESIVWIVDDAHYADDGLLDFIEHLSTVAQAPLLVVLLARPELLVRRPGLAALRRANVVGLETLSRADIAALLDGLVEGLPADVREALIARAEGNPLYAIETVRAMNDQGLTVGGPTRTPGAVRLATGVDAATLSALAAPASLQVLVASRLDLLPAQERAVLAAASVLGQTFTLGALAALTGGQPDLAASLRELVGRDLLTAITDRLSSEEGQYGFVQSVVRTVAYQTQSRRDRLTGHLAAVDYLEPLADNDSEFSVVIAQHLRDALELAGHESEQRTEIVHRLGAWLERSAERSVAVGAPLDGSRALAEALTLADEPADVVRLSLAAAEATLAAGYIDAGVEHARRVIALSGAERADVAAAVAMTCEALLRSGDNADVPGLLEPYLAESGLDDVPALTAAKLARAAAIYASSTGHLDDQTRWVRRALSLAEDSGDPREIARCINVCAIDFCQRGLARLGVTLFGLAADVARQNRLSYELALPLLNMLAFGLNRDLEAALAAGDEAMALAEAAGSASQVWGIAINQALALTNAGRWDEVAALWDRPLLREAPAINYQTAMFVWNLALIAVARDEEVDLDELARLAAMGDDTPDSSEILYFAANRALHTRLTGDASATAAACRRTAELTHRFCALDDDFPSLWIRSVTWTIEVRDFATARELLRLVTDVPSTRHGALLAAELHRLRATIEAEDADSSADPADIEADLLAGIEALDAFGAVPDRARAQATLGIWLTRRGRAADATPHLAAARQTFTDLRATAWLRELDSSLSLAATG
jgi:class 3 adenylate cyclase/tetratricopeptide (TPR) repeat protein